MDEFSSLTVEEVEHQKAQENEASYKQDFWKNLESEWRKELQDNAQSAAWLDDFDAYVPYEKYEFTKDNPLKDQENCLEEGKKKLAEGKYIDKVIKSCLLRNKCTNFSYPISDTHLAIFHSRRCTQRSFIV